MNNCKCVYLVCKCLNSKLKYLYSVFFVFCMLFIEGMLSVILNFGGFRCFIGIGVRLEKLICCVSSMSFFMWVVEVMMVIGWLFVNV